MLIIHLWLNSTYQIEITIQRAQVRAYALGANGCWMHLLLLKDLYLLATS